MPICKIEIEMNWGCIKFVHIVFEQFKCKYTYEYIYIYGDTYIYKGVSKNRGTPKWMVKILENPIKMDDLGVRLFSETPICCMTQAYYVYDGTCVYTKKSFVYVYIKTLTKQMLDVICNILYTVYSKSISKYIVPSHYVLVHSSKVQ